MYDNGWMDEGGVLRTNKWDTSSLAKGTVTFINVDTRHHIISIHIYTHGFMCMNIYIHHIAYTHAYIHTYIHTHA